MHQSVRRWRRGRDAIAVWQAPPPAVALTTYYDPEDAGYAKLAMKKDDRGRLTEAAYFDRKGRPARNEKGYVRIALRYDERVGLVEKNFYKGKRAPGENGHARVAVHYDARGDLVEMVFYDERDRPTRGPEGLAKMRSRYAGAKLGDQAFFDADGARLRREAVVARVLPGGPGERIGLKAEDVLVSYGGRDLESVAHFLGLRSGERRGGASRELHVLRGGKRLVFVVPEGALQVQLGDRLLRAP